MTEYTREVIIRALRAYIYDLNWKLEHTTPQDKVPNVLEEIEDAEAALLAVMGE
jgi:hypothetical protein